MCGSIEQCFIEAKAFNRILWVACYELNLVSFVGSPCLTALRRLQLREAEHSASQLRDDVYATPRLQYGHNHVACR